MLNDREIAIYSLGKTEGINSISETLGKDLEKIYNEFSRKMEEIANTNESRQAKSNND